MRMPETMDLPGNPDSADREEWSRALREQCLHKFCSPANTEVIQNVRIAIEDAAVGLGNEEEPVVTDFDFIQSTAEPASGGMPGMDGIVPEQ